MGLFSWLKKEPSRPEPEPEAEQEAEPQTGALAEALSSENGAVRVDCARTLVDRCRNGDRVAAEALAARLADLLADDEPMVRAAALSASRIVRAQDEAGVSSGVLALLADPVAQVRTSAVWAAARLPGAPARAQVRTVLRSEEESMRFAAACALSEVGDSAALPELTAALADGHRRQEALSALLTLGDAHALPAIAALFEDETLGEFDRTLAAATLARLGDPRGGAHLAERVAASSDDAPVAAEWAGRLRVEEAIPALEELSEREGDPARGAALRALGRLRAPGAEEKLLAIARDAGAADDLRMDAAEGLAELGSESALAALRELAAQGGELGGLCGELLAEVQAEG
jgi:HEAT repeat protein